MDEKSAIGAKAALFVCYPRCSTCAKARAWLEANRVRYRERNISTQNPSYDELRRWHAASGLPVRRFFNTSGRAYRALDMKDRLPGMSDDEALRTLATDGMLVRRPIVVSAHKVLVGFNAETWSGALL